MGVSRVPPIEVVVNHLFPPRIPITVHQDYREILDDHVRPRMAMVMAERVVYPSPLPLPVIVVLPLVRHGLDREASREMLPVDVNII